LQLSIIIINYNTFTLTCACIASILTHTKDVKYEIILVDNASRECNPELFLEKFPEIKFIKSNRNLGFAGGNNLGLGIANGEYILLLNSDTELRENSIKICLQKLQENPEIGVLSCKLTYPNGDIQHCANRFPSLLLEFIELFRIQKFVSKTKKENLLLGAFFNHETEKTVDWIWGTFFLTKRAIINQLPNKKLPNDFFMYFEDVQWCYEIQKLNYKILYFPHTSVVHHLSASSKGNVEHKESRELQKLQKITHNEKLFFKKEKGIFYTSFLYLFRGLKFVSIGKIKLAIFYWKNIF
jgi:GT2 family glycosyltransferase